MVGFGGFLGDNIQTFWGLQSEFILEFVAGKEETAFWKKQMSWVVLHFLGAFSIILHSPKLI